jgi:hypothetical protein
MSIIVFFSDAMSDFAKFVTQTELVYVLTLIIHMAAIECKLAMCISRLVDLRALRGANIRGKKAYFTQYPVL